MVNMSVLQTTCTAADVKVAFENNDFPNRIAFKIGAKQRFKKINLNAELLN